MTNIWSLIMVFFVCSLGGWIYEVILSYFKFHKFINRGFLVGPLCPIYGFGSVLGLLIFCNSKTFESHLPANLILKAIAIFFFASIISTILEYFSSWLMEKLFNNRWWDYSNVKFNINGRVCLLGSIGFGFGVLLVIYVVMPLLGRAFTHIPPNILRTVDIILITITILDTIVSFKIISKFKTLSNSVNEDTTDKITQKVKDTIMKNYSYLYKRLLSVFPTVKFRNKYSILRDEIMKEKAELKEESAKLKEKEAHIRKMERELVRLEGKDRLQSFFDKFKILKKED